MYTVKKNPCKVTFLHDPLINEEKSLLLEIITDMQMDLHVPVRTRHITDIRKGFH